MFRVRLHSPWRKEIRVEQYIFSESFNFEEADGLLCEWQPHNDLLKFKGPKIWYNSEAISRNVFNYGEWSKLKENKKEQIYICHAHPDPFYRVPMIGYVNPVRNFENNKRMELCVAVTSNSGVDWNSKEILQRNNFVTNNLVHLYGRRKKWEEYMQQFHSIKGLPNNYMGEIPWPWEGGDRIKVMSNYKAAICLENVVEPFYFTEKFYAAIQANCIPIYHAHESVKTQILEGALWVDPADHDFDINRTLEFALSDNRMKYVECNTEWLKTPKAQAAELSQVFLRLGMILRAQLSLLMAEKHEEKSQ
mgnify:CR=1 FL=1